MQEPGLNAGFFLWNAGGGVQICPGIRAFDLRQRFGDMLQQSLGGGRLPLPHQRQGQGQRHGEVRPGEMRARFVPLQPQEQCAGQVA